MTRQPLQTLQASLNATNARRSGGGPSLPREETCFIHKGAPHPFKNCKVFNKLAFTAKNAFIREHKLCYKCLSDQHFSRSCKATVKCSVCGSDRHMSVLHKDKRPEGASRPDDIRNNFNAEFNPDSD